MAKRWRDRRIIRLALQTKVWAKERVIVKSADKRDGNNTQRTMSIMALIATIVSAGTANVKVRN